MQVLEVGIIVHSVVIGVSLGASNNTCSIKGLSLLPSNVRRNGAQRLHSMRIVDQMISYININGWPYVLVQVYKEGRDGLLLLCHNSKTYKEKSPRALITVGSVGLLIYMALVDLLAAEFMGPKLSTSASPPTWRCSWALE